MALKGLLLDLKYQMARRISSFRNFVKPKRVSELFLVSIPKMMKRMQLQG